jgi:hypothetical protein
MTECLSQNDLLLSKLMEFYNKDDNITKMLNIINGESKISLRIVDWFSTNYAKKNFTVYETKNNKRFKVYEDYKLRLKAYSKKRFDPFCRWDRIKVPYKAHGNEKYYIETTIGQLNFFHWALDNKIIDYINDHYDEIESDMNNNNSISKSKKCKHDGQNSRKKREELSISATKTFKHEKVEIVVKFD